MIHVEVQRDQNHEITGWSVEGHADSGPEGFDLVCAGVSSIVFGAVNAVHALCEVELDIDKHDDGGFISARLPHGLSGAQWRESQLLMEGMLVSLQTVEASYGEYISVND